MKLSTAVLAALVACLAVATAHAQPSSGLGYIPSGCPSGPQGIATSLTQLTAGTNVYGRAYVSGSVVITNGGTANVPLATSNAVSVAIYNNVPVAPIYTTATCALNYVPANPQPWQVGTLTCFFTALLPTSGPASRPSVWTSASATATLGNGAACPAASAQISQQQPLLMGRKLRMTAQCPATIRTSISASAGTNVYGQAYVSGSVIIKNADQYAAPITSVAVALFNTVPVAPIYTTADCPVDSVPAGGAITCLFTATLPVSGPASSPSVWTKAQETVTINGAACPSVTTKVQQQQQPLMAGGSQGGN